MNFMKQLRLITIPVLVAVMVNGMIYSPALADDEAPPAPIDTPAEGVLPTDAGAIGATPAGAATAEEIMPPDLSGQVPEGTDVIVTDDSGDAVPLASEEAAQIIASADPIWCPTGKAPIALTGGCSNTFGNLGALVTGFVPTGNGVIWIQSGADGSAGNILINGGGSWSTAANFSLTLTGGWNGISGSKTISGTSTFTKSLGIIGWNAPVTLTDLWVLTATTSAGGTYSSAIDIETTGNIKFDKVFALSNSGALNGATLDNRASIHAATVTLSNSGFSGNAAAGLIIFTDGAVTLNSVSATGNSGGNGMTVSNVTDIAPSSVTIADGSYTTNGGHGLSISSDGTVTLKNLQSSGNIGDGVVVDNTFNSGTGSISLLNSSIDPNRFNTNGGIGLDIFSHGVVALKNVAADGNTGAGVSIDNSNALTARAVTISGLSEFKSNGGDGLFLMSRGTVTLSNLNAIGNGGRGAYVNHGFVGATSAVNITGNNIFSSNTGQGLGVASAGPIKLNNTTANENGAFGVILSNGGAASPQNVSVTGFLTALHNLDTGLYIQSVGTITAANLTSNYNHGEGVSLVNGMFSYAPRSITLTGSNAFENNWDQGLEVSARGTVTVNNITALWNGINSDVSGVEISNGYSATEQMNVTLNGYGAIDHNGFNGLEIHSYGIVTLNNITANDNGNFNNDATGDGVNIDNNGGAVARAVTIKGTNSFNQNDGAGLVIFSSDGAVTLNNITANLNSIYGAFINNGNPGVQSKITITGYGGFDQNAGDGLHVNSNGSITASNLSANYNVGNGVYINTIGISGPQAVTLNGTNSFTHNGNAGSGDGLQLWSDGNIKINNVSASYNQGSGAYLNNFTNWFAGSFASYGSVTQTGSASFVHNVNGDGLYVSTNGSATFTHVTADLNGNSLNDDGIHVTAFHNITFVCSSASGNFDNGLIASTPLVLTIKGFYGYNNGDDEDFTDGSLVRTGCP